MTNYAKRFRISLICDADRCIQNVVLQRISLIDNSVVLDENNWAVTLVSTGQSSQSRLNRFFGDNAGHAMLACEGLEHGKQFLRYIHVTLNPINRNPKLRVGEAQMEIFDREIPLKTLNGPTSTRSKALVGNMFSYVQEMENKPLKFSPYDKFDLMELFE